MAETTNKDLESVDGEYRDALAAYKAAKERLLAAGEARTSAHRLAELSKGQLAQTAAGMTDEEWMALRQSIVAANGVDAAITPNAPGGD